MAEQILFWSTGPEEFRFLSNFHPCRIVGPDGTWWKSAEHYFFALAAANPEDSEKIAEMWHPAEVKKFSRTMKKTDDWHQRKDSAMLDVTRLKYEPESELAQMLLMTDGFDLIHFAPWGDVYWGVGKDMKGENRQGKILMQVREELKQR